MAQLTTFWTQPPNQNGGDEFPSPYGATDIHYTVSSPNVPLSIWDGLAPTSQTVPHSRYSLDVLLYPEWWVVWAVQFPVEHPWDSTGFGSQSFNTWFNWHYAADGTGASGPVVGGGSGAGQTHGPNGAP